VTSNCTCHKYRAAREVELHPLAVYILDGAFNMVGDRDTKSCETCPSRQVHLTPQSFTVCRITNSGESCECAGDASSTSKLDEKRCSSSVALTVEARSGVGYFHDLKILEPVTGTHTVLLHSPGLLDVEYSLSVSLGNAAAFVLDETEASAVYKSFLKTTITSATSPLIGRVYDGGGNFLSSASTGTKIFVTCDTAELADYPQGIEPFTGGSNFAISCGNTNTCVGVVSGISVAE